MRGGDDVTVRIADYPNLELLCWNRRAPYVTRREAFALYERNWRFVDFLCAERDGYRALRNEVTGRSLGGMTCCQQALAGAFQFLRRRYQLAGAFHEIGRANV